ncbi:U-box domain-containing protein 35-like [Henckelia pumila]|uniref:U-box domain-containing protein 35-like n=1 Tax=Henckelia pumila TaxID=405737 RepID=UPI003C6E1961
MESDKPAGARAGGADESEGLNSTVSVVAVALSGSKRSKYIIKWALENLNQEGIPEKVCFMLLHIFPEICSVPTPMGGGIPIAQVREDVAAAYRKEVKWQTREKILPYKTWCERKKVQVEVAMIESNEIVGAISDKISKHGIKKLVLGGSSTGGLFSRGQNLSSRISECCPSFCTVYVVSKGKLSSVRPSDPEALPITRDHDTQRSSTFSPNHTFDSKPEWTSRGSSDTYSPFLPPSPQAKHLRAVSAMSQSHFEGRTNPNDTQTLSSYYIGEGEDDAISSSSTSSDIVDLKSKNSSSVKSLTTDRSWMSDRSSSLNGSTEFSSGSQVNVNFELEQLRMELRQVHGMYAKAQTEAIDASRKLNDLHQQRLEEAIKLQELSSKEEEAKELAERERIKYEAAKKEAEYAQECIKEEAALKLAAEKKAIRDVKTKQKLENSLAGPVKHYHEFSWEEIQSATSNFSNGLRIGMGSYGTVYKCNLRHTTAAVKILHSMAANRTKQFHQELEILSKIRHPHLLTLLGACAGQGCLVYEYMENGNLEERLFKKNGTPPIPWFERIRIAREVALALVFLHNSKPKPIIHRDLKPANILLDNNFVSKIGDVGLSTMLHQDMSNVTTLYKDTSPVGTLCYIDPEYQRTGLVSPKSDVYAFGMVVLQLLTAKPAIALARTVEIAVDEDRLARVLDSEAGSWPTEETKELAILGLSCTELRHRDRPDLKNQILPILEKLKTVADKGRDLASSGLSSLPLHFICPLLKDVMNDPCVAADGYTYDRKAIEEWFEENETSPVTSLPLLNKILIPNYTLLTAIVDWKSGK